MKTYIAYVHFLDGYKMDVCIGDLALCQEAAKNEIYFNRTACGYSIVERDTGVVVDKCSV